MDGHARVRGLSHLRRTEPHAAVRTILASYQTMPHGAAFTNRSAAGYCLEFLIYILTIDYAVSVFIVGLCLNM